MSTVTITQEMFYNMNFDPKSTNSQPEKSSTGDNKLSALIVFSKSDVNSALYHLIKSLDSPFDSQAIATVLVQESAKQDFIEKLIPQLQSHQFNTIKTNEQYNKALETAKKLNAHIITPLKSEEKYYQPTIVCDFSHEQLCSSAPSGIVTLHTFRTAKECIALVNKESVQFTNISIWQENHGQAYEIVSGLMSKHFFINCHLVSLDILEESIKQETNYANMDTSYHYETIKHNGMLKSVIFPIGSIFAN